MTTRSATSRPDAEDIKSPHRFVDSCRSVYRLLRRGQRVAFIFLIAARVAVGVCDLLLAAGIYLVFLLLQGGTPTYHLWWIPKTVLAAALVTAALVVVRSVMDLLSLRAVVTFIQNCYTGMLLQLTEGYTGMRWSRFVQCNRSELLNHSMYTAREAASFYQSGIEFISGAAVIMLMIAAMVYQSVAAACGIGIVIALFYGVHRFLIRNRLRIAAVERERSSRSLQRTLADMLSSGKEIRTYRNATFFHERIRLQATSVAASNIRTMIIPQIARLLADQGVVLLFLGALITVQLAHGDTHRLLSLLVFYFVLSRRLLPLISQSSFLAGQMESSYENVHIVSGELSECVRYHASVLPVDLPRGGAVMELYDVSFRFDGGAPILRSLHLQLGKGEIIVLSGASGSGKSTLLNLVAGVLQPSTGAVRIDRERIAYVPQEIALLDDSIRNNLLFGLRRSSDADLMDALALAKLDDLVKAEPTGLDTRVGDNGILLSGGQRQRLGIARAVLRRATVLLLDEATSALDEEGESLVLRNLGSSGIAILLVTHRTHTKAFADRVFRLEDCHLIEEGKQSLPISNLESVDAFTG